MTTGTRKHLQFILGGSLWKHELGHGSREKEVKKVQRQVYSEIFTWEEVIGLSFSIKDRTNMTLSSTSRNNDKMKPKMRLIVLLSNVLKLVSSLY